MLLFKCFEYMGKEKLYSVLNVNPELKEALNLNNEHH
jgi:hypothetical protein